ncbi:MAG TPA: PAS domain-containing sensor histidine kinase [Bacteroidales bacterium]|nr:PAS domain-containing sensor histidine kinase [Bacteroidales bacterium]
MDGSDFNYELYFDLSPDLLCIAGYDGYFKKINPAVSKILGYSMEELYSRPINDFVYEEDKTVTSKVRKDLIYSKPLYNFENRYVAKSGDVVWLTWTSFPIEKDKVIFAIAKNITHKKKLENERNTLLTNLTKINKELKQLNYTTSHDLRSPVNSLLSIFDLIDINKISDDETVELIRFIKTAGEQLKETLDNYVDILSEKNSQNVKLEEVSLNQCLQSVLQSIETLITISQVTISTDFSRFHTVSFNNAYMESIFLNLITNSIKYARPDHLPVITIHTEKKNGINRLIYADNGLGFDLKKVNDKIFGLHQTFHNRSDSKGIGLYLVYNHITSLGGKIEVESEVNKGTKFIISFAEK